MLADFSTAVQFILENEGGFSQNLADKGGATNYGITMQTLSDFRGAPVSVDDVKNLTAIEAETIYLKNYWNKLALNGLISQEVATILLDIAVNHGVGKAMLYIEQILGAKQDGYISDMPAAVAQLNSLDQKELAKALVKAAQLHYASIVEKNNSQSIFIRGWIARTHKYFVFL